MVVPAPDGSPTADSQNTRIDRSFQTDALAKARTS
jgi:hypothetical protein